MTVSAFCRRLWLILLVPHVASDSPFYILPSRLQLFEYESVSFSCEGFNVSAGWKVRNIQEILSQCSESTCWIDYAFASDSGEYWCESGAERSNTVKITVSTGSVILHSPIRPVMEGVAVILYCRNKMNSSNFTAHFYKDSVLIGTSFEGQVKVQNISKSQEGLYKCKIEGVGESPESWLSIKNSAVTQECAPNAVTEGLQRDACLCSENFLQILLLLRVVFTVVMVALLVLVVGLLHCGKLTINGLIDKGTAT